MKAKRRIRRGDGGQDASAQRRVTMAGLFRVPDTMRERSLDKAYDRAEIRAILADLHFTAHIRRRGEEAKDLHDDPARRVRRWVESGNLQWPRRGGLNWPRLASVVVGVDVA
jgi:hypothetical protein